MPGLGHDLPEQHGDVAQVGEEVLGDGEQLLEVGLDPQLRLQRQRGQQHPDTRSAAKNIFKEYKKYSVMISLIMIGLFKFDIFNNDNISRIMI